jgi:hypothetical protein
MTNGCAEADHDGAARLSSPKSASPTVAREPVPEIRCMCSAAGASASLPGLDGRGSVLIMYVNSAEIGRLSRDAKRGRFAYSQKEK